MSRITLPPVSPNTVEALYATGYWLFTRQDAAHAVPVFRALIHLAPQDERGWLALGACYETQGQHDLALELYRNGSRMARSAPRCEVARARILRAQGQVCAARNALATAARMAASAPDEDLSAVIADEWVRR
jgi:Flp pilus assembly protein TadD